MKNSLRIVFFGTPEFSIPALQSLIDANFEVAAVVTRPDKPAGRQQTMSPPPVKILAQKNNIQVLQPTSWSLRAELSGAKQSRDRHGLTPVRPRDDDPIEIIKKLKPNLFVIVAYGKILPQKLLDIPKHGSINIHPSLLPKYRGPSPLQATILSNDKETGVCIMLIDEAMDHGPILASYKLPASPADGQVTNLNKYNFESLGKELFKIGAKHLPEVIEKYIAGKLKPQEQDHDQATFCKMVKKEHGLIDWHQPASYIEKMTRAYFPWPGAYFKFQTGFSQGQKTSLKAGMNKFRTNFSQRKTSAKAGTNLIKLLKAKASSEKTEHKPGTPFKTNNNELAVACGNNTVLIIQELQPAGKKKMTSAEFMRGHSLF